MPAGGLDAMYTYIVSHASDVIAMYIYIIAAADRWLTMYAYIIAARSPEVLHRPYLTA